MRPYLSRPCRYDCNVSDQINTNHGNIRVLVQSCGQRRIKAKRMLSIAAGVTGARRRPTGISAETQRAEAYNTIDVLTSDYC